MPHEWGSEAWEGRCGWNIKGDLFLDGVTRGGGQNLLMARKAPATRPTLHTAIPGFTKPLPLESADSGLEYEAVPFRKNVFLLGAGASAHTGAPVMCNFLSSAQSLLDNGKLNSTDAVRFRN